MAIASFSEILVVSDTVNAWNGDVAKAFSSGDGTEAKPYIIANADQLAYLSELISDNNEAYNTKCYKLTADINFGGEEVKKFSGILSVIKSLVKEQIKQVNMYGIPAVERSKVPLMEQDTQLQVYIRTPGR